MQDEITKCLNDMDIKEEHLDKLSEKKLDELSKSIAGKIIRKRGSKFIYEVKNPNCKSCDGGCCKIFYLPHKPKQVLQSCRVFSPEWLRNIYASIFIFLFIKKVTDPFIIKNIEKNYVPYQNNPLTCRLISNKGCMAYVLRPNFCQSYTCEDRPQVFHSLKNKAGIKCPSHVERFFDKNKGVFK